MVRLRFLVLAGTVHCVLCLSLRDVIAMGPGCDDLPVSVSAAADVRVVYYFDARSDVTSADGGGGVLRANASCIDDRSVFATAAGGINGGAPLRPSTKLPTSSISVYCTGTRWSDVVPAECVG